MSAGNTKFLGYVNSVAFRVEGFVEAIKSVDSYLCGRFQVCSRVSHIQGTARLVQKSCTPGRAKFS